MNLPTGNPDIRVIVANPNAIKVESSLSRFEIQVMVRFTTPGGEQGYRLAFSAQLEAIPVVGDFIASTIPTTTPAAPVQDVSVFQVERICYAKDDIWALCIPSSFKYSKT